MIEYEAESGLYPSQQPITLDCSRKRAIEIVMMKLIVSKYRGPLKCLVSE